MPPHTVPDRQVRATFDDETITVYQAYAPEIAEPALRSGGFVPPFSRNRMTWIKPSFLWMMYRCGWATKPGQERVLAVRLTQEGFDWALTHSCLSHFDAAVYPSSEAWSKRKEATPVRVQWDPERDVALGALAHRSLQVGLGGEAAHRYVDDWVVGLDDVTALARQIQGHLDAGERDVAIQLLPDEAPFPLSDAARSATGAS